MVFKIVSALDPEILKGKRGLREHAGGGTKHPEAAHRNPLLQAEEQRSNAVTAH